MDPALFNNRELSWLQFNRRVLDEAYDAGNPLLERVKFLAIASTNLDEFFEVRVAGTMELVEAGLAAGENPDKMAPKQELAAIRAACQEFNELMHACWKERLLPELAVQGIHFPEIWSVDTERRDWLRSYFEDEVYPVLTPLAVDPAHPFPSLLNKSLNLAVLLLDPRQNRPVHRIAVVQVPRVLPRLLLLPSRAGPWAPAEAGEENDSPRDYVFMVDVVKEHLDSLFPGLEVLHSCSFRVTRDSNLDLDEESSKDLIEALEQELVRRRRGEPVRLEVSRGAHPEIVSRFLEAFELESDDVYECDGPVNLGRLTGLYDEEARNDLKDPPFVPHLARSWEAGEDCFAELREHDLLVHHPYDSFATVEQFVHWAAHDARVLAIKHTIYRAGETSAIVRDLIVAAERRKQVTVVVELKARFDEEANIRWAKRMERAGVHVVYGIVGLKTHAKATLVVRRDEEGIRHYCHIGTGNYNPTTARIYTDLGLLTANEEIGKEVAAMFNMITGYTRVPNLHHLLVAPYTLRSRLMALIERETRHAAQGRPARIRAKMNSLVDAKVIKALYRASQAGARVELCIRGICCLRPGVADLSDNIRAVSIVGRFLEHSRIYEFENDGDPAVLIASADWMTRNLDRRVEQALMVRDPHVMARVIEVLDVAFRDNVKAHEILADGGYRLCRPPAGEPAFDSQEHLRRQAVERADSSAAQRAARARAARVG